MIYQHATRKQDTAIALKLNALVAAAQEDADRTGDRELSDAEGRVAHNDYPENAWQLTGMR